VLFDYEPSKEKEMDEEEILARQAAGEHIEQKK
jgi:hypothetical protein